MRRFILIPLVALLLMAAGCSQTLADRTQQENLTQLHENWQQIQGDLLGQEDDPATPEDESVAPRIPHKLALEAHGDLLREAMELELAKKKSWQEMAEDSDWSPR